tara:strand:+ start:1205 stop:1417 length:213 start_codon:yes stop_codon:yes gene_type:complete
MDGALNDDQENDIILDFSDVDYLGSVGISFILLSKHIADENNKSLSICNLQQNVKSLLLSHNIQKIVSIV